MVKDCQRSDGAGQVSATVAAGGSPWKYMSNARKQNKGFRITERDLEIVRSTRLAATLMGLILVARCR